MDKTINLSALLATITCQSFFKKKRDIIPTAVSFNFFAVFQKVFCIFFKMDLTFHKLSDII